MERTGRELEQPEWKEGGQESQPWKRVASTAVCGAMQPASPPTSLSRISLANPSVAWEPS